MSVNKELLNVEWKRNQNKNKIYFNDLNQSSQLRISDFIIYINLDHTGKSIHKERLY